MELLIPGLILVALMVWASTKIKRDAASAFEAETIETEDLMLEKPDGFLHVLNDDSGLEIRCYSKDYGAGDRKGTRKAIFEVEKLEGIEQPQERISTIAQEYGELSDLSEYNEGGRRAIRFAVEFGDEENRIRRFYKLVSLDAGIFEMRIDVIAENVDEFSNDIEKMIFGFRAKDK